MALPKFMFVSTGAESFFVIDGVMFGGGLERLTLDVDGCDVHVKCMDITPTWVFPITTDENEIRLKIEEYARMTEERMKKLES